MAIPRAGRERRAAGFTLVEVAVVIAIVGLLLGTLLVPLGAQIQARKVKATERLLHDARSALIGFAASQGRLPCPDTDGDGAENRVAPLPVAPPPAPPPGPCAATSGRLPWLALHVRPVDAWGRVLWYRVGPEFAFPVRPGLAPAPGRLDLADAGDIAIVTRGDDPAAAGTQGKHPIGIAYTAPAAVLSTGANGLGGADLDGAALAAPAPGSDEARNARLAGAPPFVSRLRTGAATPCSDAAEGEPFCEFDDLVTWLSTAELMGVLIQAGRLP